MCGIGGILGTSHRIREELEKMAERLHHRGPDSKGVWHDHANGVGLLHTRLAILDLSPAGHQPMTSYSGRYVLVFNGEIYNHKAMRRDLEDISARAWVGNSDTETLLSAIEEWGLTRALEKAKGMFALALWDTKSKRLSLARDRMGEKPLYYGWVGGDFVFASELAPLKCLAGFDNKICRGALSLYLRYSCVPAPHSIYEGIFKVDPGCIVVYKPGVQEIKKEVYWSTAGVMSHGINNPFVGSPQEAVSGLENCLTSAIGRQMEADVSLGAFLSGGVDSSTIVALMQKQSTEKIKTFSIGFDDKKYNEAEHARAVAEHLGTEHTELYVDAKDALLVIPQLPKIYDEPFADSSQIPTFLVSQMAKQQVTVSLSGDAGDELFGGYSRYMKCNDAWGKLNRVPRSVRRAVHLAVNFLPPAMWRTALSPFDNLRQDKSKSSFYSDRLLKMSEIIDCNSRRDFYHKGFMSHDLGNSKYVLGAGRLSTSFDYPILAEASYFEEMMVSDMLHYLPSDILTKVDRAAMAVSLETRVPLLDPDVVKFSASLPIDYKIRDGVGKWVLRQVLYNHVPRNLIERPKMGFGVPLGRWLRGPLFEWAEELLGENRLRQEGFFEPRLVRRRWSEHLRGVRNWEYQLWDILMFQAWLEQQ